MNAYLRARVVADRVVAAVLLTLVSPVIGVVGWMIRRHDGGPALIRVERVGRGGAEIGMWKLRSMRAETEGGQAGGVSLTSAGDDRITPIGRRLRKGHLDELPQLLNVVRGEMALLGPRPEAPEFVDRSDPRWQAVLQAPPGIAGPTQLAVGDWERDVITAAPDGSAYQEVVVPVKLAIDGWYVGAASPRLDVMVVLGVVRRVAGGRPAALVERVCNAVPQAAAALPVD